MSLRIALPVLALAAALGLVGLWNLWEREPASGQPVVQTGRTTASGEAAIGGAFELVDHKGRTVTDKTFLGKYMLVFFGFTHCPDVCPTELQKISVALDQLGVQANRIQPLFITVDPERDTVDAMAGYVSLFHEKIVGLTGTPEQIANAAEAYKAYYAKVADEGAPGEYTMDHSAFVYLMDDKGNYVTHFSPATSSEEMAARLKQIL